MSLFFINKWFRVRVADGATLERLCGVTHREFESHRDHHLITLHLLVQVFITLDK